jgi:hypothetical protein
MLPEFLAVSSSVHLPAGHVLGVAPPATRYKALIQLATMPAILLVNATRRLRLLSAGGMLPAPRRFSWPCSPPCCRRPSWAPAQTHQGIPVRIAVADLATRVVGGIVPRHRVPGTHVSTTPWTCRFQVLAV